MTTEDAPRPHSVEALFASIAGITPSLHAMSPGSNRPNFAHEAFREFYNQFQWGTYPFWDQVTRLHEGHSWRPNYGPTGTYASIQYYQVLENYEEDEWNEDEDDEEREEPDF